MRNLHAYLNLSLAASSGEMGEHVKAASDGVYEGMLGEYSPLRIPKEDKPGILSRRSAQIALLSGLGSALPGAYSLVGPAAGGLSAEHGLGGGTAAAAAVGSLLGHSSYGMTGKLLGSAIGGVLGHEYGRRRREMSRGKQP